MFRSFTLALCAAALFCSLTTNAQTTHEMKLGYLQGQAVVKLRESMDRGAQVQFLEALRLRTHYYYPSIHAFWVKFDRSRPVPEVITMLRGHPDVEWVHENAIGTRSQTFPNDSNFSNCYALHNTGQSIASSSGTNDADMDMPEAWDLITDATNVIIAIIDSGARMTHQDLSANIWVNPGEIANNGIDDDGNGKIDDINGWAFDNNNNNPTDNDGHGTNVSGCTAARGNNGTGSTGVCWKANLMICKDGDASPSVAASAAGMEYAAMNGAVVANFSTGYGSGNYNVLQAAVNTAQNLGMIICVAAGNSNSNLNNVSDAPATYTNDNLIVVGASNNNDGKASFSSYGSIHCDVAAAGVDVYTTRRNNNSSYTYVDGTSFSAPLTTGVVGLIRAYNTSASYQTVRNAIISTCDVVSAWTGKCVSNGRVNCFAAMQLVGSGGGGGGNALNPNPMTFANAPAAASESSISMTATTASTQSGDPVQYKFTFTSSIGAGGSSSNWQSSTSHTDSGLDPNRSYGYTITARNATTQAAGTASAESTAVTHAAVPGLVTLANLTSTGFSIGDIDLNGNPSNTSIAIEVDGQYMSFGGALSGTPQWLPKQAWLLSSGPTVATTTNIGVRAKARNLGSVETAFGPSTSGSGSSSTLGACGSGNVVIGGGGFEDVFTINGSAGGTSRQVTAGIGQPFTLQMAKPTINFQTNAQFYLAVWLGVPTAVDVTTLPYSIGTMCFPICEVSPGSPTFTVATSLSGLSCPTALAATPASWSFTHPGLTFPLQEITFQGLVEIYPGLFRVSNGVIFNVN